MSYCINPDCTKPDDPENTNKSICCNCDSGLLLQDRYRVIRLLNHKSGFGDVYEIEDQGKPKILKVLKQHLRTNPKVIKLFRQEAEVLSRLNHPGIPRVETDGYFTFFPKNSQKPIHCIVMEKIEGLNLSQWMNNRDHQPISSDLALDWLGQISEILDQVHQQEYFHRDIKPANIMGRYLPLNPKKDDIQLVLIDFGTVREITGTYLAKIDANKKVTGIISPGFTPLEQANGKAVLQSDFFALGRTFVYLLTGKCPNDLPEDLETGQLIWRDNATQVSKGLADLIDYLMAPFPGKRPKDTKEILKLLKEIEADVHPAQKCPQISLSQLPQPALANSSRTITSGTIYQNASEFGTSSSESENYLEGNTGLSNTGGSPIINSEFGTSSLESENYLEGNTGLSNTGGSPIINIANKTLIYGKYFELKETLRAKLRQINNLSKLNTPKKKMGCR
ncbi:MAG: serine/threonine protein kinase [Moorea sp. SIO2B7]|nr:serine/threonine protein kinase [Moorena sp. SIO2B7]